ncbi:MAG: hypothetical protein F6J97_25760 [Leptolyngbya sp. SIO4C1]|nr:hypothetical protein [Leptolyngbya sp. SIO4C1]
MAELEAFQSRVGVTLENEQTRLRTLLERRETVDRTVEVLNDRLSECCHTPEEAQKVAETRLYGRALDGYTERVEEALEARSAAREQLESHGQHLLESMKAISAVIEDFQRWIESHQRVHESQKMYKEFIRGMDSPEAKERCNALAVTLLDTKDRTLDERNEAVKKALTVREQIEHHQAITGELLDMLVGVQRDIETAQHRLSPVIQYLIAPDEEQIQVGQEEHQSKEAQQHGKDHGLSLQLQHLLSPDSS